MMHYRKGDNIEKQLIKEELPFEDFLSKETDFLWMHVNGGTKVTNVINYAKNSLDKGEHRNIVWSGNGGGVIKTISCAEIIKRQYPLYQVTRTCYTSVEEHWKPQMEGLEEIVANRQIPSLHIFMSLDPLDESIRGLQKPNTKSDFWVYDGPTSNNNQNTNRYNSGNNRQHTSNPQQKRSNPNNNKPRYNPKTQSQQPQQHDVETNSSNSAAPASQTNPDNNQKTNRATNNHNRKRKPNNNNHNRPNTEGGGDNNHSNDSTNQVQRMET